MLKMRNISYRREEKCNTGTYIAASVKDKTVAINVIKHSLLNAIEERGKDDEAQLDCFQ